MIAEYRSSSIEQCISDIVECPICNEVLQDNRCLPCLHMFCLKCLELYRRGKPKGMPLPCPVCRKEFLFPKSIAGLPRNFFIDKLLDAHKVKPLDILPKTCEICTDDLALWRNTIGATDSSNQKSKDALASRYCCDCRQYLCMSCELQHRKINATARHKIIDSTSVTNSQEVTSRPTYCITHKTKEAEVFCQDCKMVICWQCKALSHSNHASFDVNSATKDLAAKLEEHIERISEDLHTKQAHIRNLTEREKLYTDKIDVELSKIFREARKLCRTINDNRDKLKEVLTTATSVHLNTFNMLREKLETDVVELNKRKVYMEQLIQLGNVSDLCEYTNTTVLNTTSLSDEHSCEIEVPYVPNISDTDLQDLLTGNRMDIDHQYSNQCMYMDNADKSNDFIRQLQDEHQLIDQSKGTLEGLLDCYDTEAQKLVTVTDSDVVGPPCGLLNNAEPYVVKLRSDEESSKYKDWSLKRTIAPENDRTVCGITVLDSMLYVVSQDSNDISVYSATELEFVKDITINRLVYPNDIVSCTFNRCLYICDWGTARIFRFKVSEIAEQISWSTDKDLGCLSITTEHTILLAGYRSSKLKEYTSDGELIRSIELENDFKPWHAIKLCSSDTFYLVCQGDGPSSDHRVCLIDLNGKVKHSFGGDMGSDESHLCGPYHLAVEKGGCIIVADCNNSRILLLSQDLKFVKEIIPSSSEELRRARRMFLDEDADRLYVADNAKIGSERKDGRILVFSYSYSTNI